MTSFILIQPTVWPQLHQRCRQTGQDRQGRTGRRSDSIGEPFYRRSTKMRLNVNTIKLWYLSYLITEQ